MPPCPTRAIPGSRGLRRSPTPPGSRRDPGFAPEQPRHLPPVLARLGHWSSVRSPLHVRGSRAGVLLCATHRSPTGMRRYPAGTRGAARGPHRSRLTAAPPARTLRGTAALGAHRFAAISVSRGAVCCNLKFSAELVRAALADSFDVRSHIFRSCSASLSRTTSRPHADTTDRQDRDTLPLLYLRLPGTPISRCPTFVTTL